MRLLAAGQDFRANPMQTPWHHSVDVIDVLNTDGSAKQSSGGCHPFTSPDKMEEICWPPLQVR